MWSSLGLSISLLNKQIIGQKQKRHSSLESHVVVVVVVVVAAAVAVVVESLSHVWLFVSPWTAAHQASLSFTISQSLLKLISTASLTPSNYLILYHLLLFLPWIFHSTRVFSSESALPIRWPNYWSSSFSISPSNEYSRLICFRIAVQGTLKRLL